MNAAAASAAIGASRLIAIVRADAAEDASLAVQALAEGGVRVAEISLTTPGALEAIAHLAGNLGDGQLVGAGTVRTLRDAERAVGAGAGFLVSPNLDDDVIAWARSHDILHLPGALTPTEVARALAEGAPLIKLFPAGWPGPDYVRELLAPFPEARLVPTGGVSAANVGGFLQAGAYAVAVGSALVSPAAIRDRSQLAGAARQFQSLTTS
jgi:2-dehydro-3-deoxyphosphogluconate aldolase/(4S)-4-hydroxy-2-oxoglutarate aldolase